MSEVVLGQVKQKMLGLIEEAATNSPLFDPEQWRFFFGEASIIDAMRKVERIKAEPPKEEVEELENLSLRELKEIQLGLEKIIEEKQRPAAPGK